MVDTVFSNAIDSLSDEDKKLPQVWYSITFGCNILCYSGAWTVLFG